MEKRVIEVLRVVSSVFSHRGLIKQVSIPTSGDVDRHEFSLGPGGCGANQVGPIRMSNEGPTTVDCLRELGRLIQRDHGPTSVAAP